ncbi:twitching motility protein PilT, partial [Acinetobacter baumannii]
PPFSADEVHRVVCSILTPDQIAHFEENYELDCSFGIDGIGRFRVNVYKDRGNFCAALRVVASRIPSMDDLGLPPIAKEIAQKPRG